VKKVFVLVWCFLLWSAPSLRAGDFVFGVVAASEVKETFFRFKPLARALERTLGRKVQLEPLPWPKFEAAFRKGRFHLALGSSGCYLLKGPYEGRWVLKDPRRPVVVFRAGALAKLYRGRKAAVWPYSRGGYLIQAAYFSGKFGGLDPREVLFLGSEKLVVLAVLNGKASLGWVSRRAARQYGKSLRMVEIPGEERWILFVRRDLPASTVSAVRSVILTFSGRGLRFEPLSTPPDLSSLRRFVW